MVSPLNLRGQTCVKTDVFLIKTGTECVVSVVFSRILFGERPYWWVHETPYYAGSVRPHIEQYPMTCETGPGEKKSLIINQ